ncbi:MAG: hypothetical protein JO107_07075 [Hyphomicrobiales bacterium]|nr:hypothetical protein [Hyphomicrobiales bacterium]
MSARAQKANHRSERERNADGAQRPMPNLAFDVLLELAGLIASDIAESVRVDAD